VNDASGHTTMVVSELQATEKAKPKPAPKKPVHKKK
jgi:hypothetical protein